jgi:hypothetical protein
VVEVAEEEEAEEEEEEEEEEDTSGSLLSGKRYVLLQTHTASRDIACVGRCKHTQEVTLEIGNVEKPDESLRMCSLTPG